MKINLKTFNEFVNENNELNEAKIEKMSNAWYFEEVKISGFDPVSTIKADKNATKAGSALAAYWEKGKALDKSGFDTNDESKLDLSKAKPGDEIEVTLIDSKTDKDYKVKIEIRDTDPISGKAANFVYAKVYRV